MNRKTAERLNLLLRASEPVVLNELNVPTGDVLLCNGDASNLADKLWAALKPILESSVPIVTAAEIRDAAANRRHADVLHVEFGPYNWRQRRESGIPWAFTAKLWAHCRPQIQAAIDADNAARMAEYEAYRVACEQGVAVPPAA